MLARCRGTPSIQCRGIFEVQRWSTTVGMFQGTPYTVQGLPAVPYGGSGETDLAEFLLKLDFTRKCTGEPSALGSELD